MVPPEAGLNDAAADAQADVAADGSAGDGDLLVGDGTGEGVTPDDSGGPDQTLSDAPLVDQTLVDQTLVDLGPADSLLPADAPPPTPDQ